MNKIKTWEELAQIRERMRQFAQMRTSGDDPGRTVLAVGLATCGIAAGARETLSALNDEIAENKLSSVAVVGTGCLGHCYAEPTVEVRVPGEPPVLYGNVDAALARRIVLEHVMQGALIDNAILSREAQRS